MNDREKLFDSLGPILERNRKVQEERDKEIEDRRNRPGVDPAAVTHPEHDQFYSEPTKKDRRPVPPLFALVAAWAAGVMAGFFWGLNW